MDHPFLPLSPTYADQTGSGGCATAVGAGAPIARGPEVNWQACMLAQSEMLNGTGSAEIDASLARARISDGLRRLLSLRGPETEWVSIRRLLRHVPSAEHRHVLQIWRSAVEGEAFEFRHRVIRSDLQLRECLHHGVVRRDATGRLRGYLCLKDITERHKVELRIQQLATTDPVTGLTNRRHLLEWIEAAIDSVRWDERGVAVLSLKVEQIDYLQQAMGFSVADELARAVADRMRKWLAADGTGQGVEVACLARVGGAEFALLLRAPAAVLESMSHDMARGLLRVLAQPERIHSVELVPGGRVGIALLSEHGAADGALLEAAQMAGQEARQSADHIALYTARTRDSAKRRLAIEAGLRHAVERDELRLVYRLQASLDDGCIGAAEALLRWHSDSLGEVSPSEFIAVAEESGQVVTLGEWVLSEVCRTLRRRKQRQQKPVRIFVNVSPLELQSADLVARIQGVLVSQGVEAAQIGLEITDRALLGDTGETAHKLHTLRSLGMEIALDQFGLGETTLGLLRQLPLQLVKVPMSFVPDVTDPPEKTLLLRAVVQLAHSMKTSVVALGADHAGPLSLLLANGCNRIQGNMVSAELDADALVEFDLDAARLPPHLVRQRAHPRTLLLVDDDPGIVSSLRRLFRSEGYRLLTASSGSEGLQRMAEAPVDVVLSDQRMPGMTGVEFLRRVKALYPQTVRIVLSGYTELQSITDAVNEGAIYRFLTKPWDDDQLRRHVREAFNHKGLADDNDRLGGELQQANRELALVNERLAHVLEQQTQQMGFEATRASSTRHMLDRLPVPALGVDEAGLVVMVNTDAHTLLGDQIPLLGEP